MQYYYTNPENQVAGPVPPEELETLISKGAVAADPLVVPVGGSTWERWTVTKAARTVIAPPVPPAPSTVAVRIPRKLPFSGTVLGDLVEKVIILLRKIITPQYFEKAMDGFARLAHWTLLLGAALGTAYAIYAAVKLNNFFYGLIAVLFLPVIAVAQFTAKRFLPAIELLIANTPHRLSSSAVLDCVALIAVLAAPILFIVGLISGMVSESIFVAYPFLVWALYAAGTAVIALWPQMINVEVGKGSIGEEAVGLLGACLKASVRQVPITFFLSAVVSCFAIVAAFYDSSGGDRTVQLTSIWGQPVTELSTQAQRLSAGMQSLVLVIFAALVPLLSYILYVLFNLLLEVARSILALPGKLDDLKALPRS